MKFSFLQVGLVSTTVSFPAREINMASYVTKVEAAVEYRVARINNLVMNEVVQPRSVASANSTALEAYLVAPSCRFFIRRESDPTSPPPRIIFVDWFFIELKSLNGHLIWGNRRRIPQMCVAVLLTQGPCGMAAVKEVIWRPVQNSFGELNVSRARHLNTIKNQITLILSVVTKVIVCIAHVGVCEGAWIVGFVGINPKAFFVCVNRVRIKRRHLVDHCAWEVVTD